MTADEYAAIIADHGEAMTLTRTGGASVALYGKRVGMPTDAIESGTTASDQFDVRISRAEIAATSWPEPPRRTDTISIDGRTYMVLAAQQHDDAGEIYGWKLQVVGVA